MVNAPLLLDDDLEVVERRTDVRIVLSLPGRFTLANRRDMDGKRKELPCRVINMSCHAVTLATPVTGEVGERVIALVDQFGKLEGPIMRAMDGGFVMEIIAPKRERRRLAAKIEWYEKHKNHDVDDHREHVRIIPQNPYSTLVLADGTTTECLVMDVSASGIAVSADVMPDNRHSRRRRQGGGRVVRHFNDGFAVQFAQLRTGRGRRPDRPPRLAAPDPHRLTSIDAAERAVVASTPPRAAWIIASVRYAFAAAALMKTKRRIKDWQDRLARALYECRV